MKKFLFTILLFIGLVGCSTGNEAVNNGDQNGLAQVGTNNQPAQNGAPYFDQNGDRYNRNIYYTNTDDVNYHGHLNATLNGVPTDSYDDQRETRRAQQISEAVENLPNVQNATAVIAKEKIIITVETNTDNFRGLDRRIREELQPLKEGKQVQIVRGTSTK